VAGRAPGLQKQSGEVVAWLSVWSEVQMIYNGPADATPSSFASLKSRMVYLSSAGLLMSTYTAEIKLL